MAKVIAASSLNLREVCERFQLDEKLETNLGQFLNLQPLGQAESEQLAIARQYWCRLIKEGKVNENSVKVLVVSPLIVAGGYLSDPNLTTSLEENIAEITIEAEGVTIRGRMDMLTTRNSVNQSSLCILMIETKNSLIVPSAGLPQLLTYMQSFMEQQKQIWGLLTNGTDYIFVQVEQESYQRFKGLSLLFPAEAELILQALIAIRKLQPEPVD